jgi:hypothetical protein
MEDEDALGRAVNDAHARLAEHQAREAARRREGLVTDLERWERGEATRD